MITRLLPYLLWKFVDDRDTHKCSIISSWFKSAACQHAEDAYWDPQEECIKNTSNLMLALAIVNDDGLYWELEDSTPKSPKWQKVQVEEEYLNDSVSTIKTAVSWPWNLPLITTHWHLTTTKNNSGNNTVTLQGTTLSQSTKQVLEIKQLHKSILDCFDKLSAQMAQLLANSPSSSTKCPARGHESDSSQATWCQGAVWALGRAPIPHIALSKWNHPYLNHFLPQMGWLKATVQPMHGVIW